MAKEDMPWFWAIHEIDPSIRFTTTDLQIMRVEYSALLTIVSGIQLAGPAFSENRILDAAYALEQAIGFDGSDARV